MRNVYDAIRGTAGEIQGAAHDIWCAITRRCAVRESSRADPYIRWMETEEQTADRITSRLYGRSNHAIVKAYRHEGERGGT